MLAVTLASCSALRAVSCAGVRLLKFTAATATAGKPATSLPSACNWRPVKEAIFAAVTPPSCAAENAASCAFVNAVNVAPATCSAVMRSKAVIFSDDTRTPKVSTWAVVRPSSCTALSAATRSVPVPSSALNCVRLKVLSPAAVMFAN